MARCQRRLLVSISTFVSGRANLPADLAARVERRGVHVRVRDAGAGGQMSSGGGGSGGYGGGSPALVLIVIILLVAWLVYMLCHLLPPCGYLES